MANPTASGPVGVLPGERRVDLDWLRIAAFGLLIFYHVGMFYVTWDWHVKSSRASHDVEPLMLLLNPWRLTLLFMISGVATRFMMDKMRPGAFAGARTMRLLPPLLFGMFVVVPPQTYLQLVEAIHYSGSLTDFYQHYITASGHWKKDGPELITPTWNHLWFVAYLLVYTFLAMAVGPLLKRLPARLMKPLIAGPMLIVTPWVVLVALRLTLFPIFGETHALVDDWYNHALSFGAFLFGYGVARHEAFFEACQRWRYGALGIALAMWTVTAGLYVVFIVGGDHKWPSLGVAALSQVARELQAWTAIVACFGFARRYLRHDGAARRYLTDAIFPFYIIHQTAIIVVGHYLDPIQLPLWIEAPLLIGATAGSCWLGYEIARRVPILRPLFGLKLQRRVEGQPAAAGA